MRSKSSSSNTEQAIKDILLLCVEKFPDAAKNNEDKVSPKFTNESWKLIWSAGDVHTNKLHNSDSKCKDGSEWQDWDHENSQDDCRDTNSTDSEEQIILVTVLWHRHDLDLLQCCDVPEVLVVEGVWSENGEVLR